MLTDRQTLIADAAIALLAQSGARGLTHRGVDAQAGLPAGSTSFYCRTRNELLALALRRHAALDQLDLDADARSLGNHAPTPDVFIDSLARRIEHWIAPDQRDRLVAKFELFLIASREPELAQVVSALRQQYLRSAQSALTALHVAEPQRLAPVLLMTVDGILISQVAHDAPAVEPDLCRAMLARALGLPVVAPITG
jgi:DNA-binding transcriptional regulator YbjK